MGGNLLTVGEWVYFSPHFGMAHPDFEVHKEWPSTLQSVAFDTHPFNSRTQEFA